MNNLNTEPQWKGWQKFAFRFFFLFLGFFLLNYEVAFVFLAFNLFDKVYLIYGLFQKPLLWLDRHFYHIGFDPAIHQNLPGDNHYGLVFYFTATILFLIVAIVWSIFDKRRPNYLLLNYWFGIYIRFMVAAIMLSYGIDKLIPIQMPYPNITELIKPFGDQDLFSVAWNFLGASPGYQIFSGCCEIMASLLLVFRRTYVFGALLMCSVLCNVVAINLFYNISVKLYSTLTLICVLFLLMPYYSTFMQFFFQKRSVALEESTMEFKVLRKKYVEITIGIILIGGTIFLNVFRDYKVYLRQQSFKRNQRLYEVDWFISGDTLKAVITDTLRWRKMALTGRKSMTVYNMKDSAIFYDYDKDSVKQVYRIHDDADSLKWDELHFLHPANHKLKLAGKWKGKDIQIMLEEVPVDSMTLNKERIAFLQD